MPVTFAPGGGGGGSGDCRECQTCGNSPARNGSFPKYEDPNIDPQHYSTNYGDPEKGIYPSCWEMPNTFGGSGNSSKHFMHHVSYSLNS